jgi:hypothetical protein
VSVVIYISFRINLMVRETSWQATKTSQEASNIFHSIMKASVSKKAPEKKPKKEVRQKPKNGNK